MLVFFSAGAISPSIEQQGKSSAKAEAQHALHMSEDMGYHWGEVDAEEVLGLLE